jgi:hypothetical protein
MYVKPALFAGAFLFRAAARRNVAVVLVLDTIRALLLSFLLGERGALLGVSAARGAHARVLFHL